MSYKRTDYPGATRSFRNHYSPLGTEKNNKLPHYLGKGNQIRWVTATS